MFIETKNKTSEDIDELFEGISATVIVAESKTPSNEADDQSVKKGEEDVGSKDI